VPYGKLTTGAPFHERLADHPATQKHAEKEERQELRLLYVGWTRAKDKVVLAGRSGFLQKGILRLLKDGEGKHLLEDPESNIALWAGKEIEVAQRIGMPEEPVARISKPGSGYRPGEEKMYPPAFQAASSVAETGKVSAMEKLGVRLPLTGKPDMQLLGEAIHTFLGADNVKREKAKRLEMANRILNRWLSVANISADYLVQASDCLHSFILSKWPDAIWHREYPVFLRQDNGTIVSGFIDLLLETRNGFIIIDHKSFPGSADEAKERAAGFAGQLRVYAKAVNEATGKKIVGSFIHLPILGLIASVEICRASNTELDLAQETLN
jgi:ATP-dependent exoDNAse (exonuclease V) beta subunit